MHLQTIFSEMSGSGWARHAWRKCTTKAYRPATGPQLGCDLEYQPTRVFFLEFRTQDLNLLTVVKSFVQVDLCKKSSPKSVFCLKACCYIKHPWIIECHHSVEGTKPLKGSNSNLASFLTSQTAVPSLTQNRSPKLAGDAEHYFRTIMCFML